VSEFHFVEEYQRHVAGLKAQHSRDEAMQLAVGGDYDAIGSAQASLIAEFGLRDGMSLIDLGCGSGRLAKHVAKRFSGIRYLGIDIIQDLLDYAAEQSPRDYRFVLSRSLTIPVESSSADFLCAFSLFTHLLHEETFCYLEEAKRVLVPGGTLLFSFIEFGEHWFIFDEMVRLAREGCKGPHLNMFIENSAIEAWARALEMQILTIRDGSKTPGGQSITVLRKAVHA
jgi:ubiquinone/menaquinone biosynthesis C-methylase UbiE